MVHERNIGLRPRDEVLGLLEKKMKEFLERSGIRANRRLDMAIREEIAASIEIYGVKEKNAPVRLDRIEIGHDSVGGRVVFVVLVSENDTHTIPVTGHLHDLREIGCITKDEFVREVTSILEEFNLNEEDKNAAVKECVRLMRKEKLLR